MYTHHAHKYNATKIVINTQISCSQNMLTHYDARQIVIYKHTFIMPTNYDAHEIIIYTYTFIMRTNYYAHNIMLFMNVH